MSDSQTTLDDLRRRVEEFVFVRDWNQFHSPKNLSMAMAIEAAELMEHFQWLTTEQSRHVADQPENLAPVAEELADVFCYALAMANQLGIDITTAIEEKMKKNEQKYPSDEYRGLFGPNDPNREA
jgi:NTP pyrophosphatase (non-canonical NTP hydrolase)